MALLLFSSRGERQRPWPPAHLLLEEAEVMATCPPSLSMWDEGDLDPNPPFPQEERGIDLGLFPSFLLEEGWVAMATLFHFSGGEGQEAIASFPPSLLLDVG